jgi:predicted NACHT family NTPase
LKREKSLSTALRKSQEKIILLEGEPGSGKSVALRHVALDIARRAIKSNDPESLIPFYINLKELRRENNQPINRQTIERFVIASLKRINDRDIDKFLDDEFQLGLDNGSWFFLFDSFDEIPEILGAEDADAKIRDYAEAILDFLHGLNACQGVVASRYFKGPRQIGWSRFRILNLTSVRQKELIKRSELTPISEKLLLGNLRRLYQSPTDTG